MRTRSRSTATIRWPGGRSGPGSRSSTCAWPRPRNCSSGSAEARPARHAGPVEWPHACNLHIAGQPAAGRAALARGPQLRALGGADLPVHEDGAMGVVVNRPSEFTLGDVLEQMGLEAHVDTPD